MVATLAISSCVLTGFASGADALDEGGHAQVDAALEQHRVGAGGHVAQALGDDRLGEHGRGGGAVAGDVVGLGGGFLEQLGAHVLEGVLQLDFLGHGHAVVGDGRGAILAVERHVAALRPQRRLHRVGDGVDAALERATRFFIEFDLLSHIALSS